MAKKLKVGIIGCGTIGGEVAKACTNLLKKKVELVSLYDLDSKKTRVLEKSIKRKIGTSSMNQLVRKSDLLIEAASSAVSPHYLKLAIGRKKDIMIMSIGGLLGRENLVKKARQRGINVYLPSGALAGIDALKSGSLSKIESVTLTTRKPIMGLQGAPYLSKSRINLNRIKKETVVFDGTARDAVKAFPKNINVSALLSLAGIGSRKTRVKIVACPGIHRNIHEVEIKGTFGVIKTITENVPSSANPKTSYLAALSAIATLKGIVDSVHIGT